MLYVDMLHNCSLQKRRGSGYLLEVWILSYKFVCPYDFCKEEFLLGDRLCEETGGVESRSSNQSFDLERQQCWKFSGLIC